MKFGTMDILRRLALSLLILVLAAEASAEAPQWRFRLSPYAWLDIDYRDSGFRYDVRQEGWQLGLSWDF